MTNTMRGKVAVAGVGETIYYKHGRSPDAEFKLALEAVIKACAHAGISPREIDGFSSYSEDRNSSIRLASALGLSDLALSVMQWEGGGGGAAGAVANAAAGIVSGQAKCVVALRGLVQGQLGRFGQLGGYDGASLDTAVGWRAYEHSYGLMSAAQMFAPRVARYMYEHGVKQEAMRAIALACYHHAQNNPRAIMRGRPLDEATYDASRWIAEPFHLYDCCQESDGAAAMVLVPAERARDLPNRACYVLAAGTSLPYRGWASAGNLGDYSSAHFTALLTRLYRMADLAPADVDVLQVYENFTGAVLIAMIEAGFCTPEEANSFFVRENFIVGGKLPLNTSGGHLAEAYIHGFSLLVEGARQIFRQSCNQVRDAAVSMVCAAPMVWPVSACIFGSEDAL